MKKTFIFSLLAITALLTFASPSIAEARHHRNYSRTNVEVNVGGYAAPCRETRIVRQYIRPAPAVVYVPQTTYYAPAYTSTVFTPAYVAPAPAQVYVEDVYVAPRCRPLSFSGLSFSWNFFR